MTAGRRPAQGAPQLEATLRTGPFHEALQAAVAARGLTLQNLQTRLARRGIPVAVATLSYWQRGERHPASTQSLRAVHALEQILELPPQSLTRLLTPQHRPLPTDDPPLSLTARRRLNSWYGVLVPVFRTLGIPPDSGVQTVCHLERLHVGAGRGLVRRDSQHVVRAQQDGPDRYLAIYQGEHGTDIDQVTVRAEENCRLGRIRRDPVARLLVAELLFDRRLRRAETHLFAYGFGEPETSGPSDGFQRRFPTPVHQYVLQATFHDAALPVRCRTVSGAGSVPPRAAEELTLDGRHSVHLSLSGVEPGTVGLAWQWE
ncbi:hypothetical protein ACIRD3_07275 [Kitasatospora sp. NPDC093550]|uniref:hypothetical protein n=1 Tax=Kitasatospora sp. NPDC093550 TaxID=3364089 RepID=UPI0037F3D4B9